MGWKDHCAVTGCNSARNVDDDVSLYKFPSNKARFRLWVKSRRRKDFSASAYSKVCSKHFLIRAPSRCPESVDYAPKLNLGYEKEIKAVFKERRRQYKDRLQRRENMPSKITNNEAGEKKAAGVVVLDPCAFETVGEEEKTSESASVFVDLVQVKIKTILFT